MTNFNSEYDSEPTHYKFEQDTPKEKLEEIINLENVTDVENITDSKNLEDFDNTKDESESKPLSLKDKLKKLAWQTVQFGAFGVAMETMFNSARYFAFHDGDIGLRGHSYAWMFPIWMSAAPAYNFIAPKIQKYKMITRGAIYGGAILTAEYILGYSLRETIGLCPWSEEYAGSAFAVNDLIRLDWFPLWAGAGLAMEQIWKITTGYKAPEIIETGENKHEKK